MRESGIEWRRVTGRFPLRTGRALVSRGPTVKPGERSLILDNLLYILAVLIVLIWVMGTFTGLTVPKPLSGVSAWPNVATSAVVLVAVNLLITILKERTRQLWATLLKLIIRWGSNPSIAKAGISQAYANEKTLARKRGTAFTIRPSGISTLWVIPCIVFYSTAKRSFVVR